MQMASTKRSKESVVVGLEATMFFLILLASGSIANVFIGPLISLNLSIVILLTILFVLKGRVLKSSISKSMMLLLGFVCLMAFKLVTMSEEGQVSAFLFRLVANFILVILIGVYYDRNTTKLIQVLRIALIAFMWHAVLSFFAWYFIKNNLTEVPSGNLDVLTYKYIFSYQSYRWDGSSIGVVNIFGFEFARTMGAFWEPGILQLYMNILLFISLFIIPNKKISIISAAIIITTWSTTGYAILLMQLGYYLAIRKRKAALIAVAIMVLPLIYFPLQENINEKLSGDRSGSSYARALDTLTSINIVSKNPMTGIDLDWNVYTKQLMLNKAIVDMAGSSEGIEVSVTNAIVAYFVFFGVPFGVYILYLLYRQSIFQKANIVFFMIIFVSLLTEPLGFHIFPILVITSSLLINAGAIKLRHKSGSW